MNGRYTGLLRLMATSCAFDGALGTSEDDHYPVIEAGFHASVLTADWNTGTATGTLRVQFSEPNGATHELEGSFRWRAELEDLINP